MRLLPLLVHGDNSPRCSSFGSCTSLRLEADLPVELYVIVAVPSGTALH
ncbi:hypothetical protein HMPREF1549_01665 [Actinomyces johnsonii F0510]|uniref:Uncharacterized protein n=1 Tax=Actinomyces johnsonii F0510 TaxID=1227262 RepID=U1RFR0_9ACTO|nr:hypothetical protein HMPREF1549_01665 [Actinomyces johnsonii F0510]